MEEKNEWVGGRGIKNVRCDDDNILAESIDHVLGGFLSRVRECLFD